MTPPRRPALGRGLEALLGRPVAPASALGVSAPRPAAPGEVSQRSLVMAPIDTLRANRHQPRQDFDREALEELSASIKQEGLVQPIVVRMVEGAREIIAGERRWRAAKMAGLSDVPCVVIEASDRESLVLALMENVQREDLNPIEEAEAYAALREEFDLTQDQIAEKMGKSRPAVANSLRLLTLAPEIKEDVRDGTISAGHARALLGILDPDRRRQLWREIRDKGLSVREAEEWGRGPGVGKPRQTSAFTGRPRGGIKPDADLAALAQELEARLGCRVTIHRRGESRGRVEMHFDSLEEFERIMDTLGFPASERL